VSLVRQTYLTHHYIRTDAQLILQITTKIRRWKLAKFRELSIALRLTRGRCVFDGQTFFRFGHIKELAFSDHVRGDEQASHARIILAG
jgi:hypothetical protein